MKVKFFQHLTACSALCCALLTGCTASSSLSPFENSEAVKARVNLAIAYLEQGELAKAKINIDKALSHNDRHYLPHSVLAYYYQQIGEISQAEQRYQTALTLSRQMSENGEVAPDVLNNYGTFLCEQQKFAEAYEQFELALLSQQPYYRQTDSLKNIVLCATREGNGSKKQSALAQLQKLEPMPSAPSQVRTLE